MKLRPGQQVASTVDATKLIVVRAPAAETVLTCAGVEMVDAEQAASPAPGIADPGLQEGTILGKRYADDDLGIEVLCTRPGTGTIGVNGVPLPIKEAKPLPASD